MLAQRGIGVSYETIRRWTIKFEPQSITTDGLRSYTAALDQRGNFSPPTPRSTTTSHSSRTSSAVKRFASGEARRFGCGSGQPDSTSEIVAFARRR
jgi:transposase-like protein